MKKMKIIFSVILALTIVLTSLSVGVLAANDYSEKTVKYISLTNTRALIEGAECETKISVDSNGKEQKTYVYDIGKLNPIIIIMFTDNTSVTGDADYIKSLTGIKPVIGTVEFTTENHVGLHTTTVTYNGYSEEIYVNIVEFAVRDFYAYGSLVFTENADGEFVETSNGKVFKYNVEKIRYRLEFDLVTSIIGTAEEIEELLGVPVTLNYDPERDIFKPGDNFVAASFMGKETQVKVFINENPISKISATAQIELMENVDGYWDTYVDGTGKEVVYFHYDVFAADPYFQIKLTDGKQRVGDREEIENVMGYEMTEDDTQSSKPWSVGKNKAKISLMGHECTFDVTVVESNVKSVEISGENELKVKVSYKKGSPVTHKVQDFVIEAYNGENYYGSLITDKGIIENIVLGFNGEKLYIIIEGVKSNTLDNDFIPAVISADVLLYYIAAYSITNESFAGYDGKNSSAYIDDMVSLALYVGAEPVLDEVHGVYYYHTSDLETTEKYIKELFGVSGLDLTKASGYDAKTGLITVPREAAVQIVYQILNVEYKDNRWVFQMIFSATDFDYIEEVEIIFNDDYTVASIRLMSEVGDVNGDGKITAVDARIVLQYVAGNIKEDKLRTSCADVNGDGKITAVDARMILQYVAGLL
ncbi:MAG: dockerin type I repeat-containing protein [Clostridia bacterium]|nr:dockerin type I repeat-containing protein [Clostridia bacterium]